MLVGTGFTVGEGVGVAVGVGGGIGVATVVGVGTGVAVGIGVATSTGVKVGIDVGAGSPLQALRTTTMARTDRAASQWIRKGVTSAARIVGASAVSISVTGSSNAKQVSPRSLVGASISLGVHLWCLIASSNTYNGDG